MAIVNDRTKSKRPIRQDDISDLPAWQKRSEEIEHQINEIERVIQSKEDSPDYQKMLSESKARMIDIALKAMAVDLTSNGSLFILAEMRGQFNERLVLTGELAKLRKEVEEKTTLLKRINSKIAEWTDKLMKGKS